MDEHTAKFLDAQDEAMGIPKDSKESWRAVEVGGCAPPVIVAADDGYLITNQPVDTMAIHLPVGKETVKIRPDGSVEIPEGISPEAAAEAFWQAVKANGLADAQAQRIRALQERVEGAEKVLRPFAEFAEKAERFVEDRVADGGSPIMPVKDFRLADFRAARAYFAARTKAGEPHG